MQLGGKDGNQIKPCAWAELERVLRLEDLSNAMLGINNRNLEDFTVNLGNTHTIMESAAGQEARPGPSPL